MLMSEPKQMPRELAAAIDRKLSAMRIQYLGKAARREIMAELQEIYIRTYGSAVG